MVGAKPLAGTPSSSARPPPILARLLYWILWYVFMWCFHAYVVFLHVVRTALPAALTYCHGLLLDARLRLTGTRPPTAQSGPYSAELLAQWAKLPTGSRVPQHLAVVFPHSWLTQHAGDVLGRHVAAWTLWSAAAGIHYLTLTTDTGPAPNTSSTPHQPHPDPASHGGVDSQERRAAPAWCWPLKALETLYEELSRPSAARMSCSTGPAPNRPFVLHGVALGGESSPALGSGVRPGTAEAPPGSELRGPSHTSTLPGQRSLAKSEYVVPCPGTKSFLDRTGAGNRAAGHKHTAPDPTTANGAWPVHVLRYPCWEVCCLPLQPSAHPSQDVSESRNCQVQVALPRSTSDPGSVPAPSAEAALSPFAWSFPALRLCLPPQDDTIGSATPGGTCHHTVLLPSIAVTDYLGAAYTVREPLLDPRTCLLPVIEVPVPDLVITLYAPGSALYRHGLARLQGLPPPFYSLAELRWMACGAIPSSVPELYVLSQRLLGVIQTWFDRTRRFGC